MRRADVILIAILLLVPASVIIATHASATPEQGTASSTSTTTDPRAAWTELRYDQRLLPGKNGWFMVPITPSAPGYIVVDAQANDAPGEPGTMYAILAWSAASESPTPLLQAGSSYWRPLAEIDSNGATTTCCDSVPSSYSWGSGGGPGRLVYATPESPLWVGVIMADRSPGDFLSILVRAPVKLTAGEVRSGATAQHVDLVERALAAGTNAQVAGAIVQSAPGSVALSWQPEHTGTLLLLANAFGSASAKLHVETPGEPAHDATLADRHNVFGIAARAGAFDLRMRDLEIPPALPGMAPNDAHVDALFADVDVPADAVFFYAG